MYTIQITCKQHVTEFYCVAALYWGVRSSEQLGELVAEAPGIWLAPEERDDYFTACMQVAREFANAICSGHALALDKEFSEDS
jgi:hypothetical protein